MQPTRTRTLVTLALVGAVFGIFLPLFWDRASQRLLPVPWFAAFVLWVLALALLLWTLQVRKHLDPKPGIPRIDPLVAARTVALSMAASRTGALVGGFYLGVVAYFVRNVALAPERARVISSGAAAIGAIALMLVALWLEHSCRIPEPPADEEVQPNRGPVPN